MNSDLIQKLRDEVESCEYLERCGVLPEELRRIASIMKEAISALEAIEEKRMQPVPGFRFMTISPPKVEQGE